MFALGKEPIPEFSITLVMYMLKNVWDGISTHTFTNCFRKSGTSEKDAENAINGDDDPFKSLQWCLDSGHWSLNS